MAVAHNDLVSEIRTLLGCQTESGTSFSLPSASVLSIDHYIGVFIPQAVALCSLLVPHGGVNVAMLDTNNIEGSGAIAKYNNHRRLSLPATLVRFDSMTFDAQYKKVTHIDSNDSEIGKAQYNTYDTAKVDNMKVVYVTPREVQVFPVSGTGRGVVTYESQYSSTNGLNCKSDKYKHAVCFMTASLVYEAFQRKESSARMRAIAMTLLM